MPDAIAAAFSHEGFLWLAAAAFIAGIVRGFSGFGTAMVFMPVAASVLSPISALVTLTVMDMIGPLPNVPRAWRVANRGDLMRLWFGMALALPVGLFLLTRVSPELFRYGVSLIALVLLVLLMTGVRFRGRLTTPITFGAGLLGGFLGGATGLAGPPIIMLYMASTLPAAAIRATLLLVLVGMDVLMLGNLGFAGRLQPGIVVMGLVLAVPYLLGNILGGTLFRPDHDRLYRAIAYTIIAISALSGLPFLDGVLPWN